MDLEKVAERADRLNEGRKEDLIIHHVEGLGYLAIVDKNNAQSFVTANDVPGETSSFKHTVPGSQNTDSHLREAGPFVVADDAKRGAELVKMGTNPRNLKPAHVHIFPFTAVCRDTIGYTG